MDIIGCLFRNMFNVRQRATTPSVKRTVYRPFGIDICYPEMLGDAGGATGGSKQRSPVRCGARLRAGQSRWQRQQPVLRKGPFGAHICKARQKMQ